MYETTLFIGMFKTSGKAYNMKNILELIVIYVIAAIALNKSTAITPYFHN